MAYKDNPLNFTSFHDTAAQAEYGSVHDRKMRSIADAKERKYRAFSGRDLSMTADEYMAANPEATLGDKRRFIARQDWHNQSGWEDAYDTLTMMDNRLLALGNGFLHGMTGSERFLENRREYEADTAQRKERLTPQTLAQFEDMERAQQQRPEATNMRMAFEEHGAVLGDYLRNPRAAGVAIGENVDSALTTVGAAMLAPITLGVGGAATAAVGAGAKALGAIRAGAALQRAGTGLRAAAVANPATIAAGGATLEGMVSEGSGVFNQTYDELMNIEDAQYQSSAVYQKYLADNPELPNNYDTLQDFKKDYALSSSRMAGGGAAAASLLLNKVTGVAGNIGETVTGKIKGNVATNAAKLVAGSIVTDGAQEGINQAAVNKVAKPIDDRSMYRNVGEAIATGTVVGVGTSGVTAGAANTLGAVAKAANKATAPKTNSNPIDTARKQQDKPLDTTDEGLKATVKDIMRNSPDNNSRAAGLRTVMEGINEEIAEGKLTEEEGLAKQAYVTEQLRKVKEVSMVELGNKAKVDYKSDPTTWNDVVVRNDTTPENELALMKGIITRAVAEYEKGNVTPEAIGAYAEFMTNRANELQAVIKADRESDLAAFKTNPTKENTQVAFNNAIQEIAEGTYNKETASRLSGSEHLTDVQREVLQTLTSPEIQQVLKGQPQKSMAQVANEIKNGDGTGAFRGLSEYISLIGNAVANKDAATTGTLLSQLANWVSAQKSKVDNGEVSGQTIKSKGLKAQAKAELGAMRTVYERMSQLAFEAFPDKSVLNNRTGKQTSDQIVAELFGEDAPTQTTETGDKPAKRHTVDNSTRSRLVGLALKSVLDGAQNGAEGSEKAFKSFQFKLGREFGFNNENIAEIKEAGKVLKDKKAKDKAKRAARKTINDAYARLTAAAGGVNGLRDILATHGNKEAVESIFKDMAQAQVPTVESPEKVRMVHKPMQHVEKVGEKATARYNELLTRVKEYVENNPTNELINEELAARLDELAPLSPFDSQPVTNYNSLVDIYNTLEIADTEQLYRDITADAPQTTTPNNNVLLNVLEALPLTSTARISLATRLDKTSLLHTEEDLLDILTNPDSPEFAHITQHLDVPDVNQLKDFARYLKDFDERVKAFSKQSATHAHKDKANLFVLKDFFNEQGELDPVVRLGMALGMADYINDNAADSLYNDDAAIRKIINAEDGIVVISPSERRHLGKGKLRTLATELVGGHTLRYLGLTETMAADDMYLDTLRANLGMIAVGAATSGKLPLFEQRQVIFEEGRVTASFEHGEKNTTGKPSTVMLVARTAKDKQGNVRRNDQGLRVFGREVGRALLTVRQPQIMSMFTGVEAQNSAHAFLTTDPLPRTINRSTNETEAKAAALLDATVYVPKQDVVEAYFSLPMDVRVRLSDDVAPIETLHKDLVDAADARRMLTYNNDIEIENLIDRIQAAETKAETEYNEKVASGELSANAPKPERVGVRYKNMVNDANKRINTLGATNPVDGKTSRALFVAEDAIQTIDPKKPDDVLKFKAAILQALGIDTADGVDVENTSTARMKDAVTEAFDGLKDNKDLQTILQAIKDKNLNEHSDLLLSVVGVRDGNNSMMKFTALFELAKYSETEPFTTALVKENDAVTSGVSLGTISYVAHNDFNEFMTVMSRTGVHLGENFNLYETKGDYVAAGHVDTYENTANRINELQRNPNEPTASGDAIIDLISLDSLQVPLTAAQIRQAKNMVVDTGKVDADGKPIMRDLFNGAEKKGKRKTFTITDGMYHQLATALSYIKRASFITRDGFADEVNDVISDFLRNDTKSGVMLYNYQAGVKSLRFDMIQTIYNGMLGALSDISRLEAAGNRELADTAKRNLENAINQMQLFPTRALSPELQKAYNKRYAADKKAGKKHTPYNAKEKAYLESDAAIQRFTFPEGVDVLDVDMSGMPYTGIALSVELTMGRALSLALEEDNKDVRGASSLLIEASHLATTLYDSIWQARVKEVRIANGGKFTVADRKALQKELKEFYPVAAAPMSKNRIEDGISIPSTARTKTGTKVTIPTVGKYDSTVSGYVYSRSYTPDGVGLAACLTHATDASIIMESTLDYTGSTGKHTMPTHDARTDGVLTSSESTKADNKAMAKITLEYSPIHAVKEVLDKVLSHPKVTRAVKQDAWQKLGLVRKYGDDFDTVTDLVEQMSATITARKNILDALPIRFGNYNSGYTDSTFVLNDDVTQAEGMHEKTVNEWKAANKHTPTQARKVRALQLTMGAEGEVSAAHADYYLAIAPKVRLATHIGTATEAKSDALRDAMTLIHTEETTDAEGITEDSTVLILTDGGSTDAVTVFLGDDTNSGIDGVFKKALEVQADIITDDTVRLNYDNTFVYGDHPLTNYMAALPDWRLVVKEDNPTEQVWRHVSKLPADYEAPVQVENTQPTPKQLQTAKVRDLVAALDTGDANVIVDAVMSVNPNATQRAVRLVNTLRNLPEGTTISVIKDNVDIALDAPTSELTVKKDGTMALTLDISGIVNKADMVLKDLVNIVEEGLDKIALQQASATASVNSPVLNTLYKARGQLFQYLKRDLMQPETVQAFKDMQSVFKAGYSTAADKRIAIANFAGTFLNDFMGNPDLAEALRNTPLKVKGKDTNLYSELAKDYWQDVLNAEGDLTKTDVEVEATIRATEPKQLTLDINNTNPVETNAEREHTARNVLDSYNPRTETTKTLKGLVQELLDGKHKDYKATAKDILRLATDKAPEAGITMAQVRAILKRTRTAYSEAPTEGTTPSKPKGELDAKTISGDAIVGVFDTLRSIPNRAVKASMGHGRILRDLLTKMSPVIDQLRLTIDTAATKTKGRAEEDTQGQASAHIDVNLGTKQNLFEMSPEETYVHELLHIFLYRADRSSKWFRALTSEYRAVRDLLKPEHLYDDPENPQDGEVELAQRMYDHIIHNEVGGFHTYTSFLGTEKVRTNSSPVDEYIVMAATNPRMQRAIDRISAENKTEYPSQDTLYGKLRNFMYMLSDLLGNRLLDVKATNRSERVQSMLSMMADAHNKQNAGVFYMLNKGISTVVDLPTRALQKVYNKTKFPEKLERIQNAPEFAPFRTSARNLLGKNLMYRSELAAKLVHEFSTTRKGFKETFKLLTRSSDSVERESVKLKQFIVNRVLTNIKDLQPDESTSLFYQVSKADTAAIVTRFGMDKTIDILTSDKARQDAIKEVTDSLARQVGKDSEYYRLNAEDLGYHISNGGRMFINSSGHTNAYQIARQFGRDKPVKHTNEAAIIREVDALSSLYALQHSPKALHARFRTTDGRKELREAVNIQELVRSNSLTASFAGREYNFRKGYTQDTYNNIADTVVASAAQAEQLGEQGYRQAGTVPANPLEMGKGEPMYYYTRDASYRPRYVTGVVSLQSDKTKGKDPFSTEGLDGIEKLEVEKAKTNSIALREKVMNRRVPAEKRVLPMGQRAGMLEVRYSAKGKVLGFTQSATDHTKDIHLGRETNFAESMGNTYGGINRRRATLDINKAAVKLIKDQYDADYAKHPHEFKQLHKGSETYKVLPAEMRKDLDRAFGNKPIMIRIEQEDAIFGYRKFCLSQLELKEVMGNGAWEGLKALTNNIATHTLNNRFGVTGYQYYTAFVDVAKTTLIVKLAEVTFLNILSNVVLLWSSGVPIHKCVTDSVQGWSHLLRYKEQEKKLLDAQARLASSDNSPSSIKSLRSEIATLQNEMFDNPVRPLIDAGLYQTVVEEVQTQVQQSQDMWGDLLTPVTSRLPDFVNEAGKQLFMTRDTSTFRIMSDIAQMSDFVARWALYNHDTKNMGVNHSKAIENAAHTFVNYDMPTTRVIQTLNDIGLAGYTKYFFRIQQVLLQRMASQPSRMLALFMVSDILGGTSPTDSALLSSEDLMKRFSYSPSDWAAHLSDPALIGLGKNLTGY